MANLDVLLSRVHDEFSAVPKPVAMRALSDSAKEFFSRSHCWQDSLSSITVRAGEPVCELDTDTGVVVASLLRVSLDGRRLDPISTEILNLQRYELRAGLPDGYVQWSPDTIELIRVPSADAKLDVKAALSLALNATHVDVPDAVVNDYGEAIASGAKMRLVRQANQPWYAPDSVLMYAAPYYSSINTAKRRANSALDAADMQVQMRPW